MKLNILIICHYYPPLHSIASLRPYSFSKYWAEEGHSITVLTTAKSSEQLILPVIEGIKIVEIDYKGRSAISRVKGDDALLANKNSKRPLQNFIKKLVAYLRSRFGIFAAERIPEIITPWIIPARRYIQKHAHEFDVVLAEYSPPSALYLGFYAKSCSHNKTKLIFDYRDSWTVSNYSQPGFPPIRFLEKFIENIFIKHADLVSTTQKGISREFNSRGYANTLVVENGYFDDIGLGEALGEKDEIAIVYTGSYGGYRSIDFLEGALTIIKNDSPAIYERINVYILGQGTSNSTHPKLIFKGKVSYKESLQYQKRATILFLVESGEEIARYNIPGKFFEYFRYKTPIVAFGPKYDFEISKYLADHNIGMVSDATSVAASKAILTVINCRNQYNGSRLDEFSRRKKANQLLERIKVL